MQHSTRQLSRVGLSGELLAPMGMHRTLMAGHGSVLPAGERALVTLQGGQHLTAKNSPYLVSLIPSNCIKSRNANEEIESYPSSIIC